ncbi:SH3 domain-containing protein [Chloroflexia bacterium SDU3-3]|nr:SH3 domain-containing protein [Chloroflexia bacterium SDU3-3]
MARDEDDYGRHDRTTQSARRPNDQATERMSQREIPQGEPLRSDWLSSRTAGRPSRRRASTVPSSRQEFALWLQYGGWRTVLIIAGAAFATILLLIVVVNGASKNNAGTPPDSGVGVNGQVVPTPNPFGQPTVTPAAPPPAAATGQFRVKGTDGEGLFLRSAPGTSGSTPIDVLPDGTIVTVIGDDEIGQDYTWKHIRAPSGKEGWAAAKFLEQVQ